MLLRVKSRRLDKTANQKFKGDVSMETLKRYKHSFWRVPLIALIAAFLYTPLYVRIVLKFGVVEPDVIDDRVSLLTSAGLLVAIVVLGGIVLLRKQTRKEIFVSAAILSVYGLLLMAIQLLTNSTTGPAAVVFMYLSKPLEWTGFFPELYLYLQEYFEISLPIIGWLRYLAPFLFVLFGRRTATAE